MTGGIARRADEEAGDTKERRRLVRKPGDAETRRAARIARFHLFWNGLAPWHVLFSQSHSVSATVVYRARQRLVRVEFCFPDGSRNGHLNPLGAKQARSVAAAVDLTSRSVVRLWLGQ